MTGGGSGGHITPILAVAAEVKRLQPDTRIIYIGQKGDHFSEIPAQNKHIDNVYVVRAGKFRRYHGAGWKQIFDVITIAKNCRDAFFVVAGFAQSLRLLRKLKPDLVFVKGGFVGVPVGLAAAVRHIPYVTHDSDAIPGLANRIIARWARMHTVAMPEETYVYPRAKTVMVGVPIDSSYQPVTPQLMRQYREQLNLTAFNKILLVTGGGLGAQRINESVLAIIGPLLEAVPDLAIVHTVGSTHEKKMRKAYDALLSPDKRGRVVVKGFVTDLYRYSGAADVVVARAGATNLAELAVQGKPSIIIPNPFLTGGHQLKNAELLARQQAIVLVHEHEMQNGALLKSVTDILNNPAKQTELSAHIAAFARPDAAQRLAMVLLEQAAQKS